VFLNSSPIEETAPFVEPTVTETEQTQVDRITPFSVEHIQNSLANPQTDFVLPTELDHYTPSTDDHDETESAFPVSSGSSTRLIPYTTTNKLVYKHQYELNGLLEELGKIDSHCDAEVMERRKEVVQAVKRGLEGGERVASEVVEQRSVLPLQSSRDLSRDSTLTRDSFPASTEE
jgi:DNA-binding PucR family transcriptional regulator